MTPVTIPFQPVSAFSESVTLDRNEYTLSFYWNTRGEFWSMNIADANGATIITGIRLVINYPLRLQHPQLALPPGEFVVVDPSGSNEEPGRDDFTGNRNLELQYLGVA
jgi:hypothetical protein